MVSRRDEENIPYSNAGDYLAELLTKSELPSEITTFDNFVQDICSQSYPHYNFNTWHVRKLASHVDTVINDPVNKYLLAALPRYHLKSTVLGYFTSIYRMLTSFGDGMYISYKDELANYHISNIKNFVRENPILSKIMEDTSKQSDTIINYRIGRGRRCRMYSSGVLSVKRGMHTDTITICDDVLGDLQNPMVLTELDKVKRIYNAEILNIPNKDCPLFVYGTVIDYTDLLYTLRENEEYHPLWLPAIDPDPEHDILWPSRYDKEWLMRRRGRTSAEWKAFSTEFLLTPIMATEAFLSREEVDKVTDRNLKDYAVPGY